MRNDSHGFTIKELFAVMFIIMALSFCLLPFGRTGGRAAARRMACQMHLKQLGLAMHIYHDAHGVLPQAVGGTGAGGNENRLNGLVALLPYLEETRLFDQIMQGEPPGGPAPWDLNYPPWQAEVQLFRCPTAADTVVDRDYRWTSYAFCIGDVASDIHYLPQARGAFAPGLSTRLDEIGDGLSQTIFMSEIRPPDGRRTIGQIAVNLPRNVLDDVGICQQLVDASNRYYRNDVSLHTYGRGYNWADGAAGPGLVNTILPPNSPSCAVGGIEAVDGIYSAGSHHPGGCQVLLGDASVQMIWERIDCGDLGAAPLEMDKAAPEVEQRASPFGVWGSLGTANGHEEIDDDF
ncbi:DUF1559 domain-containing protein [Bremerella sp. JC817]|uniref:DUF1559 domain-containing protein n=1 Tax=Bremerella sp. JC817 TaxID=3231756 RepID=UPI00345A05B5